jgi:Leucine-rich repeat (LRR) protein
VVEDDLSFFTGLLKLDVSENKLKLNHFSCLPRLKELRIACNMVRNIEGLAGDGGFARLQVLDLSYNALNQESIRELYILPSLRELDLCGNELRELPPDFCRFAALEKVLLEHNMIKDNFVFDILAKVPRLRDVTLAYNSLTAVPARAAQEGSFK